MAVEALRNNNNSNNKKEVVRMRSLSHPKWTLFAAAMSGAGRFYDETKQ